MDKEMIEELTVEDGNDSINNDKKKVNKKIIAVGVVISMLVVAVAISLPNFMAKPLSEEEKMMGIWTGSDGYGYEFKEYGICSINNDEITTSNCRWDVNDRILTVEFSLHVKLVTIPGNVSFKLTEDYTSFINVASDAKQTRYYKR